MIQKKAYLVLTLAIIVLLAGCTGGGTNPGKESPFCGGIEGVELEFLEGSPPTEVFDNNQFPFDVTLRLLNKGEHSIAPEEARVELSGISSVDFGGPSYSKIITTEIQGTHKDSNGDCSPGNPETLSFGSGEEPFRYMHSLPGNTLFTLRADLCYKYRGNATVQFCVQKEAPRFGQDPTCKVDDVKTLSNSGGPLQIENFKQTQGGGSRIAFSFDILHQGTGAVHSGALCDNSFQSKNKVHVKVYTRGGNAICSTLNGASEGDVILIENKRTINCQLDTSQTPGNREFETPLNIELVYLKYISLLEI